MSEQYLERDNEVKRWRSVLEPAPSVLQARHEANGTLYTNNFLRHFMSDIPPYEGTGIAMTYDWRNWPNIEPFEDIRSVFAAYRSADKQRWQTAQQAAVTLHEMTPTNNQTMPDITEEQRQALLLENETIITTAFLEIAAEVGRVGVDPRILIV